MKYWEIIADNIKKRGWSLGYVSAIDSNGRMIWIADTRRGDGQRFVARADELLTAFVELESAIRARCSGDSDAMKDVIERPLTFSTRYVRLNSHACVSIHVARFIINTNHSIM